MLSLVLFAGACDGTVDISDDSSAGADDTGTYEFTGPDPVIFDGELVCTGGDAWEFTLTVGDQQGADTVTGGTYKIFADGDGSEWGDGKFDCKGGTCAGTGNGGSCAQADQFKFFFLVTDADGNVSRAHEIYGQL